jgi:hypothetical protein
MSRPRGAGLRAIGDTVTSVFVSVSRNRLTWLLPLVVLLLALAGLLALLALVPGIAPVIYPVL